MRLKPVGDCPQPKSIKGTLLLTVRILENARKEPNPLRRRWYDSRECQDLLDLSGISRQVYKEILGLQDDYRPIRDSE